MAFNLQLVNLSSFPYIKHRQVFFLFFGIWIMANFHAAVAQTKKTRVLIVFDVSRSMKAGYKKGSRMEEAKKLFSNLLDSLSKQKNMEFALRLYGSTKKYPPGDCNDSKLVVPFGPANQKLMKEKVMSLKPTGITPIAHSLVMAANDFPDTKAVNMILLITDGLEECGGDPCEARKKLGEKGILFKPCIIGIGLSEEQAKAFQCVGNYFSHEDQSSFHQVVEIISNQKLNKTTAQLNLLDVAFKPSETNVNVTFYEERSGKVMYNYLHSLNVKGNPDTIPVDEGMTYKIVVHTIPEVIKEHVTLQQGIHNVIAVDAPQGSVVVNQSTCVFPSLFPPNCVVRKSGAPAILDVVGLNKTEKLLIGEYDLEILTLPRTYFRKVKINQSQQKQLEVPVAGKLILNFPDAGEGGIFLQGEKELEWVCNLNGQQLQQTYYLQPGKYVVTYRSGSHKNTIYSVVKKLEIKSNEQLTIYMQNE